MTLLHYVVPDYLANYLTVVAMSDVAKVFIFFDNKEKNARKMFSVV